MQRAPLPAVGTGKDRLDVKLFVKRFPTCVTEAEVISMFSKYGEVLSVSLSSSEANDDAPCTSAVVHMASITEADAAVRGLSDLRNGDSNQPPLEIIYAQGESDRLGFTDGALIPGVDEAKLFVGSLPRDVTEASLTQFFFAYGNVRDAYLMKEPFTRRLKGCGFIKFEMKERALLTIAALHGRVTFPGGLRLLELRVAEPKRPSPMESSNQFTASTESLVARNSHAGVVESNGSSPATSDAQLYPIRQDNRAAAGQQTQIDEQKQHAQNQRRQHTSQQAHVPQAIPYQTHHQQHSGNHQLSPTNTCTAAWAGRPSGGLVMTHPAYPTLTPASAGSHSMHPGLSSLVSLQHVQRLPAARQQTVPHNFGRQPQPHGTPSHHDQGPPQCRIAARPPNLFLLSHSNLNPRCAGSWKEYFTPEGRPYYHNETLGLTHWDMPMEFADAFGSHRAQQPPPPPPHLQQHLQHHISQQSHTSAQHHLVPVQQTVAQHQHQVFPTVQTKQGEVQEGRHRYEESRSQEMSREPDGGSALSDNDDGNSCNRQESLANRHTNITGPPGANIFIFHVPNDWLKEDLAKQFEPYGSIVSAKVALNRATQRNKGYGFVSFDNVGSALLAVNRVNLMAVGNKRLRVAIKKGEEEFARAFAECHGLPYLTAHSSTPSGSVSVDRPPRHNAGNNRPMFHTHSPGTNDIFLSNATPITTRATTSDIAASDGPPPLTPSYPVHIRH